MLCAGPWKYLRPGEDLTTTTDLCLGAKHEPKELTWRVKPPISHTRSHMELGDGLGGAQNITSTHWGEKKAS